MFLTVYWVMVIPLGLVWTMYRQELKEMAANWPVGKALCLGLVGNLVFIWIWGLGERAVWLTPIAIIATAVSGFGALPLHVRMISAWERLKSRSVSLFASITRRP